MADIQLTAQQRGAVEDRGGSLLVSAAAGSGKTKVLVERVFAYLTEEHCHIDDFLIITFTRAAAAELRTKLAAELAKRVAQDPENSHLRQQMFRVYQADIKTVDGFCAGLLREHIHLLEPVDGRSLTPDFRILDETEAGVLKQRALEDALEAFYQRIEQGDEGCRALAETLGFGRDDRALAALRDLATIRDVSINYDTMKPADVIAQLGPLTKPGSAYFGSAGELVAMAHVETGNRAEAGRIFAEIAKQETARTGA